jgi:hypothetical protein
MYSLTSEKLLLDDKRKPTFVLLTRGEKQTTFVVCAFSIRKTMSQGCSAQRLYQTLPHLLLSVATLAFSIGLLQYELPGGVTGG